MTSHKVWDLSTARKKVKEAQEDTAPLSLQKVVSSVGHCISTQRFTVERLGMVERSGNGMAELLAELEEQIEMLDLSPIEENKIVRIMERLRDESRLRDNH